MKIILATILFFIISLSGFSQLFQSDQDYEDLMIMKADQSWKKLIIQADKYTSRNRTKDDAEPYYYLAYGLYKISFIGDRPDEFKNAYKDALTTVGKMARKDEDNEIYNKYEDFFIELKLSLLEVIRNEIESDDYRRAFGWVMKIYKFGRDNISGKFLEAACRYRNGDKATANSRWREGRELIDELESTSSWDKADREMIKFALYESAKALKESRQQDEANEIMNLGAQWFEEDKDWQMYYDKIVHY